jgi:hypothetical protein
VCRQGSKSERGRARHGDDDLGSDADRDHCGILAEQFRQADVDRGV